LLKFSHSIDASLKTNVLQTIITHNWLPSPLVISNDLFIQLLQFHDTFAIANHMT